MRITSSGAVAHGLVVLAAATIAACSGDQLAGLAGASLEPPAAATGAASAYGESTRPAPTDPNPLATDQGTATGGRQVIATPTIAEILQAGPLPEMSWGRADAPVVVVKYMSLTCPYCRKFHSDVFPDLKKRYIDTGKVRFILREFPIGKTSGTATIALRCAAPARYLDLYAKYLDQQASWVSQEVRPDAIYKVAQQVGLRRDEFDACLKDQRLIDGLKWVKDRGRTLGIIGTPNFFVAGKLVKRVLTMAELAQMIDGALTSPPAN